MEQRDYLKKQIDALGQVLGKIMARALGLKAEEKQEQASQFIWNALKEEADIDFEEFLQLPEETFLEDLRTSGKLSLGQQDILADLLFEALEGMPPGRVKEKLKRRLLLLYQHLSQNSTTFSLERHYRIEQLQDNPEG